ncbi:MAG: hypothetical protein JSS29_03360 [Proteobacteria bacterium]|nr:hypothetical protein [Pseudomonadota bacterium]
MKLRYVVPLRSCKKQVWKARIQVALFGLLGVGLALASEPGEKLALQVCSACHVVAATQQEPPILNHVTPSFCAIANRPETTLKSVSQFVLHTHWDENSVRITMPDPMLMPDQAAQVARYVLSLRGRCQF